MQTKFIGRAVFGATSLLGALVSSQAMAATQGSQGATSTGQIVVTANVPNRARISGLTDVSFLNKNPSTAANGPQNVCVWSNTATKSYRVTATGSGAANSFRLANGSLTVPYLVRWNAAAGRTTGTNLTAGTASAILTSSATHQSCAVGPAASASLIVRITAANLASMQAMTVYSGTLTLVVSPQ